MSTWTKIRDGGLKIIGMAAPFVAAVNPLLGAGMTALAGGDLGDVAGTYIGGTAAGGKDVVGNYLKNEGIIGKGTFLGDLGDKLNIGGDTVKKIFAGTGLDGVAGAAGGAGGSANSSGFNSTQDMLLQWYFADKAADKQITAATEAAKLKAESEKYNADMNYNAYKDQMAQNEEMFNAKMDMYEKQYNQAREDVAPWLNVGRAAVDGLSQRLFAGPNLSDIRLQDFKYEMDPIGASMRGESAFGKRNVVQGVTGYDPINPADYGIGGDQAAFQRVQGDHSNVTAGGSLPGWGDEDTTQTGIDGMVNNVTTGNPVAGAREFTYDLKDDVESPYQAQMDVIFKTLSQVDPQQAQDSLDEMVKNGVILDYSIDENGRLAYEPSDFFGQVELWRDPETAFVKITEKPALPPDKIAVNYPEGTFVIDKKDVKEGTVIDGQFSATNITLPDGTKLTYDGLNGTYGLPLDKDGKPPKDPWKPQEYRSGELISVMGPTSNSQLTYPASELDLLKTENGTSLIDSNGQVYTYVNKGDAAGGNGGWAMGTADGPEMRYMKEIQRKRMEQGLGSWDTADLPPEEIEAIKEKARADFESFGSPMDATGSLDSFVNRQGVSDETKLKYANDEAGWEKKYNLEGQFIPGVTGTSFDPTTTQGDAITQDQAALMAKAMPDYQKEFYSGQAEKLKEMFPGIRTTQFTDTTGTPYEAIGRSTIEQMVKEQNPDITNNYQLVAQKVDEILNSTGYGEVDKKAMEDKIKKAEFAIRNGMQNDPDFASKVESGTPIQGVPSMSMSRVAVSPAPGVDAPQAFAPPPAAGRPSPQGVTSSEPEYARGVTDIPSGETNASTNPMMDATMIGSENDPNSPAFSPVGLGNQAEAQVAMNQYIGASESSPSDSSGWTSEDYERMQDQGMMIGNPFETKSLPTESGPVPGGTNPDGSVNPYQGIPDAGPAPKLPPTDSVWNEETQTYEASKGFAPPPEQQNVPVTPAAGIDAPVDTRPPIMTDTSPDGGPAMVPPTGSATTGSVPTNEQADVPSGTPDMMTGGSQNFDETAQQQDTPAFGPSNTISSWDQAQKNLESPIPEGQDPFDRGIQYDENGMAITPNGPTDPRMIQYQSQLANDPRYRAWAQWEYEKSPAFQFRMKEGQDSIQQSAAARGGLLSGATMKDLNKYAQGVASQDYNMERAIADARMADAYNMDRQRAADSGRDRAAAFGEFWDQYGAKQNEYNQAMNEHFNSINAMANVAGMGQNAGNQSANLATQFGQNSGNAMNVYGQTDSNLNLGAAAAMGQGNVNAANAMADATAQAGNINANRYQGYADLFKNQGQDNATNFYYNQPAFTNLGKF